ncbi:MAG: amidohydrolase family protein, partial [Planctomycetota bacterium]
IVEKGISILCRGGRIEAIGPDIDAPAGAMVIDAPGTCALPGLIDAHVRLDDGFLVSPVYLFSAWGVTTVRDLDNTLLRVQGLNDTIQSGEIVGPNIIYSGESLTHKEKISPFQRHVENSGHAEELVKRLVRHGAGHVLLSSGITSETAAAVIETASEHGLPVTADLLSSRTLDARDALRLGARSLERLGGIPQAIRRDNAPSLPEELSVLFCWLFRDEKKEAELIREIVERDVYLIPTLVAFEKMSLPSSFILSKENMPAGLPPSMTDYWREIRTGFDRIPWWASACRLHLDYARNFVRQAAGAGAKIVAGSGTPTPGVGPGTGLHREIELLVEAGLTPAEALNAATLEAARCLGREQDLGSLEPGKIADLVLVQGNPLEEIGSIKEVCYVIQRGRLVKREEIPGFK